MLPNADSFHDFGEGSGNVLLSLRYPVDVKNGIQKIMDFLPGIFLCLLR